MTATDFGSKKIKRLLLAVIFIALGAVIVTFIVYRGDQGDNNIPEPVMEKNVDLALGTIHHTATKDGNPQWRLDADSVAYDDKKQSAILKNIKITFFVENRSPIYLTADQGFLNSKSNNMHADKNVVTTHENYTLRTEKLEYNHKKEILYTKVPVDISGEGHHLVADTLQYDLNSKKALLEGNVKGIFDADFTL
ncbi:MAG: LPS export ABC transporter periplasmic protein LptC [Desulfobacterales bacterium]|nr:LPS export ABC transporter periplasmic protein LptC [Desulfobacterales bacterium]